MAERNLSDCKAAIFRYITMKGIYPLYFDRGHISFVSVKYKAN